MTGSVALIGCGAIAGALDESDHPYVLTHAKAVKETEGLKLAACFDIDVEKAKKFATTWNVEKVIESEEELFLQNDIDIFVIASSTESHANFLKKALNSEASKIICEKPIVDSIEDWETISPLLLETKKDITVNFTRRFDKSHRELAAIIHSGKLGALKSFSALVRKGFIHNGSHLLDLLYWYFGGVEAIDCKSAELVNGDLFGAFLVSLKSGIKGTVQTIPELPYSVFDLDLVFENAKVEMKNIGQEIVIRKPVASSVYTGFFDVEDSKRFDNTLPFAMKELYKEVLNKQSDTRSALKQAIDSSRVLLELKEALPVR